MVKSKTSTSPNLGILDFLAPRGFDPNCAAKFVRHQDKRYNIQKLINDGWFDLYQAHQSRDIFGKCDYIVAFAGDGGTRAKLIGIYKVIEGRERTSKDLPKGTPFEDQRDAPGYFYELEHQSQYADLEGRIVIDWGSAAISWHQYITNKPVIEVYPPGRSLTPFADYLDFSLSFSELQTLFKHPDAHRDWKASLSAVSGIYLILAETTGHQYVGSAYGLSGIWGRWLNYSTTGHGGNKLLKELVSIDSRYPESFRFSLLQVLPKTSRKAEVIRWENQYKLKLGSRATGLNASESKFLTPSY